MHLIELHIRRFSGFYSSLFTGQTNFCILCYFLIVETLLFRCLLTADKIPFLPATQTQKGPLY